MKTEDKTLPFVMTRRWPDEEYQVSLCDDAWAHHDMLGYLMHQLEDDLRQIRNSKLEDDRDLKNAEILRTAAGYSARRVKVLAAELREKLERLTLEIEDGPVTDLGVSDLREKEGGDDEDL